MTIEQIYELIQMLKNEFECDDFVIEKIKIKSRDGLIRVNTRLFHYVIDPVSGEVW